jgi:hypothetical protein
MGRDNKYLTKRYTILHTLHSTHKDGGQYLDG